MKRFISISVLMAIMTFASVSCNKKEPFDVLAAQQKLCGVWNSIDNAAPEKTYQIAIEPNGVVHIHIKNLCEMGDDAAVNVNLLDEKSLLIPTQTIDDNTIGGTGTISDEFMKMIFELYFNQKLVTITCNKVKK